MKKFTFDFNLEAWVAGVEIEADTYDEAMAKLNAMSAYDLVDSGYTKEFELSNIDYEVEDDEDDYDDFDDDFEETTEEDVYKYLVDHDCSGGELSDLQLHKLAEELWEVIHREEFESGEAYESVDDADLGEIIDASDAGTIARTYGYKWLGLDDTEDDEYDE